MKSMSVAELAAELRRRQSGGKGLLRKRAKLMEKVAAIDAQLAALGLKASGGASGGGMIGRTRPQNSQSLVEALAKLLKGKTMGVTEAAEAVVKAGYNTNAANFRTIVNQTLIKHKTVFKKVERGQYTAI